MVVLGLALLSPATTTWAKKASSGSEKEMKQLDLSVHQMRPGKVGTMGTNDKVQITVAVKATSSSLTKICSGFFRVLVSKNVARLQLPLNKKKSQGKCVFTPALLHYIVIHFMVVNCDLPCSSPCV